MFEKSVFVGADMFCEEYKQLESEWSAARGEWIYFRLGANNRAPGITEGKSKELVSRAKDKMEDIKNRMKLHVENCEICDNRNDAIKGIA